MGATLEHEGVKVFLTAAISELGGVIIKLGGVTLELAGKKVKLATVDLSVIDLTA